MRQLADASQLSVDLLLTHELLSLESEHGLGREHLHQVLLRNENRCVRNRENLSEVC